MYGYLTADIPTLTESEQKRYKALYCGLCHTLKERHGDLARMTLNYDMTFLVIFLSSLYAVEECSGEDVCIRHPASRQLWSRSDITAYAADMNIALAYLKKLDDWNDDDSVSALLESKLLKKSYDRISAEYPRQCSAMEKALNQLSSIEAEGDESPDRASACFGYLMREIFVMKEDMWSDWVRGFADALGRYIYLLDAIIDLDTDVPFDSYNPFSQYFRRTDNEERFRDILKMELGESLYYFDKLPLLNDIGLMKNILCCGLWAAFNRKFSRKDS